MTGEINPALAASAQDVPPESSPGQGGAPEDRTPSADTPHPVGGQTTGDADAEDQQGQRTPDNVRGELLRKLESRDHQWTERFARIEGMLQQMQQQPTAPQPSSPPGPPKIEEMTSAQLEAMRGQVPEAHRPELDRLVQQRKIDEQVAQRVDQRLTEQSLREARVEANRTAYTRWPELRDSSSRLYQMANSVLNERGDGVTHDPRALLDAANEAGVRLGLQPKSSAPSYGALNVPRNSQPPQGDQQKPIMSRDEAANIARRLQDAMPSGKFDLDRVMERHNEYVAHKDLFIRQ